MNFTSSAYDQSSDVILPSLEDCSMGVRKDASKTEGLLDTSDGLKRSQ